MKKNRKIKNKTGRRKFLKTAGAIAAASPFLGFPNISVAATKEVVHWSWLGASDAEVWKECIEDFNKAHDGKGVQIVMETIANDQYDTKLLAAAASGKAPDFGWQWTGSKAKWANDGVIVPMDKLISDVGLDLADFSSNSIDKCRYPQVDNQICSIPMDLMTICPEVNMDHVAEAGLDPDSPPMDSDSLIDWGVKMTKQSGGKVTRSGIIQTASSVQPNVTWGIVAHQMGFQRASDDLRTACINPKAGIKAMEWVLDLFDKHKCSSRDISDRYKAFGQGEGSIFWTGPWTINGYVEQGLNFRTYQFPNVGGKHLNYFEAGSLEMYVQKDSGRYEETMKAIKWLSDNSFKWTTVGRGGSPRASILNRSDYKTAGPDWSKRGAFIEQLDNATIGEIPVLGGGDFTIYSGGNGMVKILDPVWIGQKSPDQAMEELQALWQKHLDKG